MNEDFGYICNFKGGEKVQYQKFIYNNLLPYVDELEAESEALLAEIKENLGRAIICNEVWPGCYVWVSKLCHYIKIYGLKFSKDDHILLIKLLFELVTVPQIPTVSTFKCISVLFLLLKKKKLISPEELELPWRPLYKIFRMIMKSDDTYPEIYNVSSFYENAIQSLILWSKTYFPLSATQEILDEFRPTLCPLDELTMTQSMLALRLFLPVQVPPQHHSMGYRLWFQEFMTLWEISHNAPEWEHEMMELIASLANYNIGYIDWEPYIPLMFTRFMRSLKLPVSYNKIDRCKHHEIDAASIAVWIVAVLGHGSSAQTYLEKFLKTIETYFHPANSGSWLGIIKEVLTKLSFYFITRLHKERYGKKTWETPVPEEYKLTDSDVDAFVQSMIPVTMTAIFNKLSVNDASQALHYLATLRPNLVIPYVMDKVSSTLDSLSTESYKLIATFSCMEAIARPMAEGSRNVNTGYTFPEGPAQILPLLYQLLPIIDPNNPEKCILALRLISVYACFIPIVDSSKPMESVDEEGRLNLATASGFEDFVLQFLDKIFSFIDYSSLQLVRLENASGGGKSKLEKITENMLYNVWMILLRPVNETIFRNALNKLRAFIAERILEIKVAGQLAASMCRVFACVNGKETLRALLPELSQIILDITGESNDIVKEENLDSRLLHAMLLLSTIVDTVGSNLLPHIETLSNVLDRVLVLRSREGNNLACMLLSTILHSLSAMVPYDYESTDGIRYLGEIVDIKSLNVKWYIPGKDELETINELFMKYLLPEINKLEQYCNDWTTLTREELRVSLNIVNNVVQGCESVLPMWEEEPLNLIRSSVKWLPFRPTLGTRQEILMPDGGNVKRCLVRLMSKVQNVILKNAESDTKSLLVLTKLWCILLLGNASHSDTAVANHKQMENARRMMADMLVRKKGVMGCFILPRSEIQHLSRSYSQIFNFTETHKEIILNLVTLATSRYAGVRWQAQCVLSRATLYYYLFSWEIMLPKLVEILNGDPEANHDEYKGALHVLLSSPDNPIVLKHNWTMLRELWSALILSMPSEKLSIIRLKTRLMEFINKQFSTIAITFEVPRTCIGIANNLWKTDPRPDSSPPDENETEESLRMIRAFNESNMAAYKGLLDDLLKALLEQNLHWRHRLMALDFIRQLVHPEQIYPPKVVRYFLQTLVHESLHERNIAIRVVTCMLHQQKRKSPKITIDPPASPDRDDQAKCDPSKFALGQRADNNWLQYDQATRPLTQEQWDEPRYVHKSYIGYYTWPKKIEMYAPSSQQPSLDQDKRVLTDHEKEVHLFFNDPQNIQKLIKFCSLETKKEREKFNIPKFLLFKSLFRNHGIVFLKHFLPHLRELVVDKQHSSQTCAAEIVTGIIKGSKHWPFDMVREMWDSLLPIIKLALLNLSPDTVVVWTAGFCLATENRDPNRQHWLLEWLMEEIRFSELESSLVECGRLFIFESILRKQPWRVLELQRRLLKRIEGRLLANPFENVRTRLGSILLTVFMMSSKSSHSSNSQLIPRLQEFVDKIIPELQPFVNDNATKFGKEVETVFSPTTSDNLNGAEKSGIDKTERERAIRLLKTVCEWILNMKLSWCGFPPELYKIFPAVYQLENCETDEELKKSCTSALAVYAHALTLSCDMPVALEAVEEMSKHVSWWTRSACLEFIQAWVFYNMGIFLSNPAWVTRIKDIVLRLLNDERVEVRKNAGTVLSGLLHCGFIPEPECLLDEFKKKAEIKLYKRERSNCSKDVFKKNLKTDALQIRHAAITGMCAFVQAHPYDIPKYVPPIFEHLSPHMNDPEPIPTTIKKTLDDFKRTHNGWRGVPEHSEHFTEEQLSALQDLILPPSYYA